MSVGVVNKQTGDRIPTAGMPAIDSVLSGSSTNPVQNRVVKAALDEKADTDLVASDFDATASYTAGNYCIYEGKFYKFKNNHSGAWAAADVDEIKIAGELSTLKSGLTNLDTEVNGDATTYPYADVITIEDAIPANLAECNVKIDPVQDLHGYDKPWIGGAGVNILPSLVAGTYEKDGIIVTVDNNGNMNISGTKTTASAVTINVPLTSPIDISANYYLHIRNDVSDSNVVTMGVTFSGTNRIAAMYDMQGVQNCVVYIASTTTLNINARLSIEKTNDVTDWSPYTNYCPITGHTEVDVQRVGKNLVDVLKLKNFGINSINGKPISMPNEHACVVNHVSGKTVTVSRSGASSSGYFWYGAYDTALDSGITPLSFGNLGNDALSATIDVPVGTVDLVIFTGTDVPQNLQVELGSTATPYVPYAGKTYTIALGDTIYGGTVDFDSGVMTVDRAFAEFDGSSDELWQLYNAGSASAFAMYINVANIIGVILSGTYLKSNYLNTLNTAETWGNFDNWVSAETGHLVTGIKAITTVADWKTYLASNPLQVCYELATPTTIQLTPQQIQLLKGQNTLTASTGQISVTANGVSGAIGSVQEQVNELAEDVAELQGSIFENWTEVASGYPTDRPFLMAVMHTVPNSGVYDSKLFLTNPLGRTVYFNLGSETGKSYLNGQGAYTTNEIPQDYVIKVYAKA